MSAGSLTAPLAPQSTLGIEGGSDMESRVLTARAERQSRSKVVFDGICPNAIMIDLLIPPPTL